MKKEPNKNKSQSDCKRYVAVDGDDDGNETTNKSVKREKLSAKFISLI